MTTELLEEFKSHAKAALGAILDKLSSDDTKGYFLCLVTNSNDNGVEGKPYTILYNAICNDYGYDYSVVEDELPSVVDEVAEAFISLYPSNSEEETSENELECYYDDLSEEYIEEQGLEIVVWAESQYIMELPNYRKHSKLINSEEGLDLYGSSAYVVETAWLDDFRNDNLYDY